MVKRTLYLCTYIRGNHPITDKVQPYHWIFFIQTDIEAERNNGIVHQLRGMPGGFYYQGPEEVDLWKSELQRPKETVEIGELDDADLEKVHVILKSVQIDKSESSGWNCQDWSLDGFARLQREGFVYDYLTREAVKTWLKEEEDTTA